MVRGSDNSDGRVDCRHGYINKQVELSDVSRTCRPLEPQSSRQHQAFKEQPGGKEP